MSTEAVRDALTELAPVLRVRPELDDFCRFGGSWTAGHDAAPQGVAYFHIVTRGHCLLDRPGNEPLELTEGDVLVLPHGDTHAVRSRLRNQYSHEPFLVEFENSIRKKSTATMSVETELVCGRLHFEAAAKGLVASVLPNVIVLKAANGVSLERYRALMSAIQEELDSGRPGSLAIATDIASALFVMMLRNYLELQRTTESGLLKLLADRITSKAVQAMVREPARAWSLDDLADLAATSRATLVRSFRKTSGFAPLAFLSELRLGLVHQRLQSGREPLAKIAIEAGFQSEASMSRAFHRRFGVRPGASRKLAMSADENA
ncbi:AraC family transcriptional regulator [Dyella humicola]|uniref:AraC family transcriptional regulator n=1 Tax=Dyella humicola TaxID=2992126 RepID=UPI00225A63BA|nr:AraC family transcriptional regulator [Dyella humicola]